MVSVFSYLQTLYYNDFLFVTMHNILLFICTLKVHENSVNKTRLYIIALLSQTFDMMYTQGTV